MTPETKVKQKLKAQFAKDPDLWVSAVSDRYHSGLPDFIGVKRGEFAAWECKAPGKDLSKLQRIIAGKIMAAGGRYYRVTLDDDGRLSIDCLNDTLE